ncbi:kelch repeat protein [Colletotrichum phormii]|uniref:Kelch repeat protein n=1 Tax=Colletotrichum phormii TaxID=359342 RepID=A0AAI9ZGN3_9PEZI|nr:kelch repeat protein [Colletotrichum phormii]KAK1624248.1 kelch repeat protein [Colletotrichum phormii]
MAKLRATWARLASNDRLRRSSQAVSVVGNQAYVFGGELLPRKPVDNQLDFVELHSEKGTLANLSTISIDTEAPTPRVGAPSTALKDAFYLFSGRGGIAMEPVEETGGVWRYTPTQTRWDLLKPTDASAPHPAGRSYHCTASDGNKTIYVHAGCPEKGRLSDLSSFDIESKTWKELAAAPPPARGGASIAFSGGKLYRMNGFDGTSEQGGALDVYDPASAAWSTISYKPDGVQGPEARSVSALVAVEVDGKPHLVTLFGEHDPSSLGHAGAGKMLSDLWAFDVDGGKWEKVFFERDAPPPRGWFDADVVVDGIKQSVVVHGGLAEDNSRLGDVWRLNFA